MQWTDFCNLNVIFGLFSKANPTVRSLYTLADISVTSDPMYGFQSVRGHYGVVFQEQSNSEVTVQIR